NADTVSSSIDQTYRARHPVFATMFQGAQNGTDGSLFQNQDGAGKGVQVLGVVEDQSELQARYEPSHPSADAKGYVYYPNVNVVEEMADMISASRSFQTNAEMMNTAKTMMQKVLTLGQ
ncbi:flagellar basal body rod protein FlgC, partial [Pseudomonas fragi]|nr:flagellar basal body rod protein FlgC [Pseudomonas sp. GC01]